MHVVKYISDLHFIVDQQQYIEAYNLLSDNYVACNGIILALECVRSSSLAYF